MPGGEDPAYLLPDQTGRFLLTAYYEADKVTVHQIRANGSISESPIQMIETADKAHGIVLDSKNQLVFVPHTGANRIYQFRFDASRDDWPPATRRLSVRATTTTRAILPCILLPVK